MEILLQNLVYLKQPITLDLAGNQLREQEYNRFLEFLKSNWNKVKNFSLSGNPIQNSQNNLLGNLIKNREILVSEIALDGLVIDFRGLLEAVTNSGYALERLSLQNCQLDSEHARHLALLLESNAPIKHLDLRGNRLRDQDAQVILSSLLQNTSLVSLSLDENYLTGNLTQRFQQVALQSRPSLQLSI